MQAYINADQQLHLLSQSIAKANRTFVPSKENDSHTNLYFDPVGNKMAGRWIETNMGPMLLSLNLTNLQYEWINDMHNVVQSFSSSGKTADAVEREIEARFDRVGA